MLLKIGDGLFQSFVFFADSHRLNVKILLNSLFLKSFTVKCLILALRIINKQGKAKAGEGKPPHRNVANAILGNFPEPAKPC